MIFELIRSISKALSEIKSGDPINYNQISARVTPRVEKSNFYKDIEKVIEWEFKNVKKE